MDLLVIGLVVGLVVLAIGILCLVGQLVAARTELARQRFGNEELEAARREALEAQTRALEDRFSALAVKLLDEKQQALAGRNSEHVGQLFGDLKEKLQKYEDEVAAARKATEVSAQSMANDVRVLNEFAMRAQQFTAALIGGNKIQGGQGEQILARVLEQSGFQLGREYDLQVGTAADGGRPDVCVYDARNKSVIYIDAKMNIKDYIEAYNLPDDTVDNRRVKKAMLKKHATSIRTQIDGLAARRYAETVCPPRAGYVNLPLVAMFCPFNAVLEAALSEDPTLMEHAYRKNIVLVTPTTLWGYFWLVSAGWKRVETEKKYEDIQALGGVVVDRIDALLQEIEELGQTLTTAMAACESLKRRAGDSGQKSIKRAAQALLEYGVAPKRAAKQVAKPSQLPERFQTGGGGGEDMHVLGVDRDV